MSPMSLYTFDAQTLQHLAERDERDDRDSARGERTERWIGQAAMALIGLSLLAIFLV